MEMTYMNTNHKIRIGLNESTDERFCLTENHYYRILDEYTDLIDKEKHVVVVNNNGQQVDVKKDNFVRFEMVPLSNFQKILEKQS